VPVQQGNDGLSQIEPIDVRQAFAFPQQIRDLPERLVVVDDAFSVEVDDPVYGRTDQGIINCLWCHGRTSAASSLRFNVTCDRLSDAIAQRHPSALSQ